MTSYVTPKKGFPFICYVGLVSQSTGQFQSNPTLAAGDFKISKDGGALANLATLPAVTPAASKSVKISLDSDETNADNLVVIGSDAAGAEWDDLFINIQTTVRQIDDLAFPTTSGRSMDVTTTGEVGIDWANIGSPTTVINLSGTTVKNATDVLADTANIKTRIPAALSGDGFIKADLKSIDDETTDGNNATLNLKQLNIVNNSGNGIAVLASGGDAINLLSDNQGIFIQSSFSAIYAGSSLYEGLYITSDAGDAVGIYPAGNGDGVRVQGAGTGKSINAPNDIAVSDGDLTLANIRNGLAFDSDVQDILSEVTPLTFDSDNYVLSHPMTSVVVGTNNDKSNYTLTSAYDASKTASQDSDMFDVLSYVSHLTFDSDDKVFANAAVSLTSDDIDQIVNALSFPTANENATTLLKYDWNTITGEADRSVLNALRKLRNKVSFSGGTLSIKKEDDLTNAYTQAVTQDSDQEPFKSVG